MRRMVRTTASLPCRTQNCAERGILFQAIQIEVFQIFHAREMLGYYCSTFPDSKAWKYLEDRKEARISISCGHYVISTPLSR
jgi:hypothetical protein